MLSWLRRYCLVLDIWHTEPDQPIIFSKKMIKIMTCLIYLKSFNFNNEIMKMMTGWCGCFNFLPNLRLAVLMKKCVKSLALCRNKCQYQMRCFWHSDWKDKSLHVNKALRSLCWAYRADYLSIWCFWFDAPHHVHYAPYVIKCLSSFDLIVYAYLLCPHPQ